MGVWVASLCAAGVSVWDAPHKMRERSSAIQRKNNNTMQQYSSVLGGTGWKYAHAHTLVRRHRESESETPAEAERESKSDGGKVVLDAITL